MAKFSKYNQVKRKRRTNVSKVGYIPTWEEIDYCRNNEIDPQFYVDLKFEKKDCFKNEA